MTSASIVLYRSDVAMVSEVIRSFFKGESQGRKLYLVDNSPTDELKKLTAICPAQTEYVFNNANVGYGAGHNVAIRRSIKEGFKYHVVLNPDLSFEAETIPGLERFMDEHEEVGLCMPDIRDMGDGHRRPCSSLLPTPMNGILRRFATNWSYTKKKDEEYLLAFADYTQVLDIPYLSGCFMFFRNTMMEDIGLFDENIFMYYEDTDISRRMYLKHRACYVPYVTAKHVADRATYKSRKMLWVTIKSAVYYFNKYGWVFDGERRRINKHVLKTIPRAK